MNAGPDRRARPWIRTLSDGEATGKLAEHYAAALRRAGKVFQIVRVQSLRPAQLEASMALYRAAMFGPSGLTRAEREFVAAAVSAVNHCHY
jgi:alkylhydroperoxidase family enzyme